MSELPEDRAAQEAWDARAQAQGETQAERLYKIYAGWSGQLHTWCRTQLGRHVDAEFFPLDWKFKVYSGAAGTEVSLFGVPSMMRPPGEKSFTLRLPGPSDEPSDQELNRTFYNLCLATARLLEIELGTRQLGGKKKGRRGHTTRILAPSDSPDEQGGPIALPPGSKSVECPGPETEGEPPAET